MQYSGKHGNIRFPAEDSYSGFTLTHRCLVPPPSFNVGFGLLAVWSVLAIFCLLRAYWKINFGSKSGGLWKMNEKELLSIANAMKLDADIDGDGELDKSELIAAITQSAEWPSELGLSISTFETVSTDSDSAEWINISWFSPVFILDVFSCIACTIEGFTDMLFVVLQFSRPNNGGLVTGSLSLTITLISTLLHMAPPNKGLFKGLISGNTWTLQQSKDWVKAHARSDVGAPLRSFDDWKAWLATPAGKHRPSEVSSIPHIEYRKKTRVADGLSFLCCSRKKVLAGPEPTLHWVNWADFFGLQEEIPNRTAEQPPETGGVDTVDAVPSARGARQVKVLITAGTSAVKNLRAVGTSAVKSLVEKDRALSEAGEPGWLCGAPPDNEWDSDAEQAIYGRISTPLMYLMTILQLRVPVEGMIAWRNCRMLKSKVSRQQMPCTRSSLKSVRVRVTDFERARVDLQKALLREGIFEALPQAVLEFQNLWADEWAVLDLMSVPGLPFITAISEYQLTFGIMCCTILTATIDISTPYTAASPLIKVALLASACTQLTSRLLVFGAVLSMEPAGKATTMGTAAVAGFFVCSTMITMAIHLLCVKAKLYHRGDAAYRNRTDTAHYKITIKTSAEKGAGTTAQVGVVLHGDDGCQRLELGSSRAQWSFEPGSTRSFPFECEELGPQLDRIEIGHDGTGDAPDWKCDSVTVVHMVDQRQWTFVVGRWLRDQTMHSIAAPNAGETVDAQGFGTLFNMQKASWFERMILFVFINSFACTDQNLTTAPTSRGVLVLSFWRITESAAVSLLLVPQFGAGQDLDGDGEVDAISAFQVKAFMAIFLSLGSFACLLAATAAEQILASEARLAKSKDGKSSMSRVGLSGGRLAWLMSWLASAGFLVAPLFLCLLTTIFTAEILYSVGGLPFCMTVA